VVLELLPDGIFPQHRTGRNGEAIIGVCLRAAPAKKSPRAVIAYLVRKFVGYRTVKRTIRKHGIGIAHIHYSSVHYSVIASALQATGTPWVNTFHGSDIAVNLADARCAFVMQGLVAHANAVSVVSKSLRDDAAIAFPAIADKIVVVHNSVSAGLAEAASVADAIDVCGNHPSEHPTALFVGNLIRRKGVDVLLTAWSELLTSEPAAHSWVLTIAGDGVEMPSLVTLANALGISDSVRFLGMVPRANLAALMASASVMIVPSRSEPFGLVAAEAEVFGRAIVASATGGLAEIVQDGVTGLLVPPDDAPALAAALRRLVSNPGLRRRLGTAARKHATREFSPEAMVRKYTSLYEAHA
jgi:glycosyltransferase involved in cell wall biosynthesis